jgi:hypothetical protein
MDGQQITIYTNTFDESQVQAIFTALACQE